MFLWDRSEMADHEPLIQPQATDEVLVQRYKDDPDGPTGRQAASLLLARYRKLVLLWCGRYVQDRETALDLAQEILLKAYRNLGTYREREKFSAWLFIIARNSCLSELRRKKLPLADAAIIDFVADPGQSPEKEFDQRRAYEKLEQIILATLTDQERDALWMRCFEAMPVEAITHQLGIEGLTGARAVLQKARRKLRRALDLQDETRLGGGS